jgi:chromatin assembly factor 1 subunit A
LDHTEYKKRFQPFFLKTDTTLAKDAFALGETELEQRAARLDEHVARQRQQQQDKDDDDDKRKKKGDVRSAAGDFKIGALFCVPGRYRGISRRPVASIVEDLLAASECGDTLGIQQLRTELATIPRKVIKFAEDVRPPYQGSLTRQPACQGPPLQRQPHPLVRKDMARLGRHPISRGILQLQYDYDSEAEWADEEEGEDVDVDDEDDELDDDDDMDGFLDDSEDTGVARHAFQGDMEPESSGLRFEDGCRQGGQHDDFGLHKYRLEFVLGM